MFLILHSHSRYSYTIGLRSFVGSV